MSAEERMEVCKKCPLYKETEYGPKCNEKKFINKEGQVSWVEKHGYVQGCGCYLLHKTARENNHCIVGK